MSWYSAYKSGRTLDLLGRNDKNILLAGECKFKNTPFDNEELENFMSKIKYLPVTDPVICLFSLNGFTDSVKKNAGNCRLVSIEDMYS